MENGANGRNDRSVDAICPVPPQVGHAESEDFCVVVEEPMDWCVAVFPSDITDECTRFLSFPTCACSSVGLAAPPGPIGHPHVPLDKLELQSIDPEQSNEPDDDVVMDSVGQLAAPLRRGQDLDLNDQDEAKHEPDESGLAAHSISAWLKRTVAAMHNPSTPLGRWFEAVEDNGDITFLGVDGNKNIVLTVFSVTGEVPALPKEVVGLLLPRHARLAATKPLFICLCATESFCCAI